MYQIYSKDYTSICRIGLQVVQEILLGCDGDGDVGGRVRRAGAHVAGKMGPIRAGRVRRLVFHTAGQGGPVAQRDPVRGRVRRALPVHRGVLRAHILHRAENGTQVPRDRHQPLTSRHDNDFVVQNALVLLLLRRHGRRRRRRPHGLLHPQDPVQGARDIHRLGHRFEHGHRRHVQLDHRLQGAELPVAARPRGHRPVFVRPGGPLLARIVHQSPDVQAPRPVPVISSERHHHASRVCRKSEPIVFGKS